ncbi:MAG: GHKL domain-containing protein [Lachnospiraceae bacterium]|nr:GHKL domain-containing protein [Lachnospiraceae bacterium]
MLKREMLKRETQKVRMLGEQYELLQRTWSEHAMLFHDMDNHLQTIYHLAGEGRCQEIREYIARISMPIEQLSGMLWTGVGIVDAVLNDKRRLAQERGCSLDINAQLPVNTGIAGDDFCTILTNLIDNAIESVVREQTVPEREAPATIGVAVRQIHHFVMIRITNPCGREPERRRGLFCTAKADRLHHGWGLKRVQQTVQRYNGSFSCELRSGKFVATAMLCMCDTRQGAPSSESGQG